MAAVLGVEVRLEALQQRGQVHSLLVGAALRAAHVQLWRRVLVRFALDTPDADAAVPAVLLEPVRGRAGNSASELGEAVDAVQSLPSSLGMALGAVLGGLIYNNRVHRLSLVRSFKAVAMSYSAVARGLMPPAWTAAYKRLLGGRAHCPPRFSVLGVPP